MQISTRKIFFGGTVVLTIALAILGAIGASSAGKVGFLANSETLWLWHLGVSFIALGVFIALIFFVLSSGVLAGVGEYVSALAFVFALSAMFWTGAYSTVNTWVAMNVGRSQKEDTIVKLEIVEARSGFGISFRCSGLQFTGFPMGADRICGASLKRQTRAVRLPVQKVRYGYFLGLK